MNKNFRKNNSHFMSNIDITKSDVSENNTKKENKKKKNKENNQLFSKISFNIFKFRF